MVRYKKSVESGVVRVPKPIREAFGDEIVITPNLAAAAIYSPETKKKNVIKSLRLIIQELQHEILLEKEKEGGEGVEKGVKKRDE